MYPGYFELEQRQNQGFDRCAGIEFGLALFRFFEFPLEHRHQDTFKLLIGREGMSVAFLVGNRRLQHQPGPILSER